MIINKDRPLEELTGANRWTVEDRLGRVHVGTSTREQLREARPKSMRNIPVRLRRGWAKLALETIEYNRALYRDVMSGQIGGAE